MPRILSIWSPTWPIAVWRRKTSVRAPDGAPFVLVQADRGVRKLYAVCDVARACGLFVGQKAADASALVPGLAMADADPFGDDDALETLVDWCCRFSPAVAKDAPDGLFLDLTGVSHLWGGEDVLMDDLLDHLAAQGVPARAAIADTPGCAWAIARFGQDRRIVASGDEAAALGALPVAALRLEIRDADQLVRLGATRIAHLARLPRAAVSRRFGAGVLMRLDQALGRAGEALAFRRPASPWVERLSLAEPISAPEDIARVALDLATAMEQRLAGALRAARRFEFAFHRLDGALHRVEVGLSRPGRDPAALMRLLSGKLDVVDPGFGIEVATLAVHQVEAVSATQGSLSGGEAKRRADAVAGLVDSLANRLGEAAVWRPAPRQSHAPERAVIHGPALDASPNGWDPDLPRPIRLFSPPEPVEMVVAALPDEPPAMFRWRGRPHRVRHAEGPERIAQEWWRGSIDDVATDKVRDYYRVEDEAGARYWLFRAGVHGAGYQPQWWVHGLFG